MKGTLISIFVGALAGVLLTVGSSLHASHAAASRAAPDGSGIVVLDQAAVDSVPRPDPAATAEEPAPLAD